MASAPQMQPAKSYGSHGKAVQGKVRLLSIYIYYNTAFEKMQRFFPLEREFFETTLQEKNQRGIAGLFAEIAGTYAVNACIVSFRRKAREAADRYSPRQYSRLPSGKAALPDKRSFGTGQLLQCSRQRTEKPETVAEAVPETAPGCGGDSTESEAAGADSRRWWKCRRR